MHNSGVCLWLTGPSGAGKSTVTRQLVPLLEACGRTVTVLDVVPELAKHWAERTSEGKLLRKAFVAREVVRHGGVAICVTVSRSSTVRQRARALVGAEQFIEILVDAPAEVTTKRRSSRSKKTPFVKRVRRLMRTLRRRARPGRPLVRHEAPTSADIRLDSAGGTPEENAAAIMRCLAQRGFVPPGPTGADPVGAYPGPGSGGAAGVRVG